MENYVPNLLNQARAAGGLPSDYALGKAIGVAMSTISRWRDGTRLPLYRHVVKLCVLANVEPQGVIAIVEQIRESRRGMKAWIRPKQQPARDGQRPEQRRLQLSPTVRKAVGLITLHLAMYAILGGVTSEVLGSDKDITTSMTDLTIPEV